MESSFAMEELQPPATIIAREGSNYFELKEPQYNDLTITGNLVKTRSYSIPERMVEKNKLPFLFRSVIPKTLIMTSLVPLDYGEAELSIEDVFGLKYFEEISFGFRRNIFVEKPYIISKETPWADAMEINQFDFIRIYHGNNEYDLVDFTYEGNILRGEIRKVKRMYSMDKDYFSFKSSVIPENLQEKLLSTLFIESNSSLSPGPFSVEIQDIYRLTRYKKDKVKNASETVKGIFIGTAVAATVTLAILCNCPRVYSIDDTGNKNLQGVILSGAISKSLEREELLPIDPFYGDSDTLTLRIANELPEKEFINQLSLFKVKHRKGYQIARESNGSLLEFQSIITPDSAKTNSGLNIRSQIEKNDNLSYAFDSNIEETEFNSVIVSFLKSRLKSKSTQLIIRAKQTEWLEKVSDTFFSLYGNTFDKLTQKMDKTPKKILEKYMARQGIYLNVYMNTKAGWKNIGYFANPGIIQEKLLSIDLNWDEVSGEEIQIKLESGFKFWEINQIGLTQDGHILTKYTDVPLISGKNESGENIIDLISHHDKKYAIQQANHSYIDLVFENNLEENEIYVFKGSGYYHHERNYPHPPVKQAIKILRSKGNLAAHSLSIMLWDELRIAGSGN